MKHVSRGVMRGVGCRMVFSGDKQTMGNNGDLADTTVSTTDPEQRGDLLVRLRLR